MTEVDDVVKQLETEGYLFETEGGEWERLVRSPFSYVWTHNSRFKMWPERLVRLSDVRKLLEDVGDSNSGGRLPFLRKERMRGRVGGLLEALWHIDRVDDLEIARRNIKNLCDGVVDFYDLEPRDPAAKIDREQLPDAGSELLEGGEG